MAAANWSPSGTPQPSDNLTVVSGTLEISRTDLAGNVLNLQDSVVAGGPVVLDLNGDARVGVQGSLFFGDNPTINAAGSDRVDASGGLGAVQGTINLADHAHLIVTGTMQFAYTDTLAGPANAILTNNGTIKTENGNVSVAVNGNGTLGFSGYHDGHGFSLISAPIAGGQTVDLDAAVFGMTMTLTDPGDFHGLLKITQSPSVGSAGDVSVVLEGVRATSFPVHGDQLMLKNGHRTVDTLRIDNVGSVPISASFGTDSTTLTFLTHRPIV
jgi:hypothetical protein